MYHWARRHSLGQEEWLNRTVCAVQCAMHEGNAMVWARAQGCQAYQAPAHVQEALLDRWSREGPRSAAAEEC